MKWVADSTWALICAGKKEKGAEVKVARKKIKEKGAEVNVADKKIKEKGVFRKPSGRSNKKWQQETATGEGAPTKANEKPPDEEKEDGDNEEEEEGNVFYQDSQSTEKVDL